MTAEVLVVLTMMGSLTQGKKYIWIFLSGHTIIHKALYILIRRPHSNGQWIWERL